MPDDDVTAQPARTSPAGTSAPTGRAPAPGASDAPGTSPDGDRPLGVLIGYDGSGQAVQALHYAARTDGQDADLVASFPRYHPQWAWWMVNVPGFREVAVSNLVLVLRKR